MTQSRQTTPAEVEAPPASPLDAHPTNGTSTRSQGPPAGRSKPKPKGPKATQTLSQSQSTAGGSLDQVIDVESAIDIV
ncbi:hypothetical protein KEM48_001721 [Puccinia striiformis f. sp. tritici PST-130]|nr:hypothetical protein Pst134EB_016416 [Puccinia striiformis f. sp. tritici]KAI9606952.1 hypothetical protein KEM48_001721 [Puccinia striiformis f. sp. tritici PST-130]